MTYNIGDKVRILPHEQGSCEKSSLTFQTQQYRHMKTMANYVGSVAKITQMMDDRTYRLDIDDGDWCWGECMLQKAPKYAVGDTVYINWMSSIYISEGWYTGRVVKSYEKSPGSYGYLVRSTDYMRSRTFDENELSERAIATTCSPEGSTLTIKKMEEMIESCKKAFDEPLVPHFVLRDEFDFKKSKLMNELLDYQWDGWKATSFCTDPITDWMKERQKLEDKKERSPMKYKVGDKVTIIDKDDAWYKKTGVITRVEEFDEDLPYKVEVDDEDDWYAEDQLQVTKKGGLMSRLTILAKKVLDKDLRDLLKAGVLNEDLSINDSRFVLDFVVANFKKELADAAREKLADMKEDESEE